MFRYSLDASGIINSCAEVSFEVLQYYSGIRCLSRHISFMLHNEFPQIQQLKTPTGQSVHAGPRFSAQGLTRLKLMCQPRPQFSSGARRFSKLTGCWKNVFPCDYKTEDCQLLARDYFQFLEATHISCHVVYIFSSHVNVYLLPGQLEHISLIFYFFISQRKG